MHVILNEQETKDYLRIQTIASNMYNNYNRLVYLIEKISLENICENNLSVEERNELRGLLLHYVYPQFENKGE